MSVISYILEKDVNRFSNLSKIEKLGTLEDVATLIETFEDAKERVGFDRISDVYQDDEGFYYFIIADRKGDFDLFDFINSKLTIDIKVSCLNAKVLFPKKASRGMFDGAELIDIISSFEEDAPTQFLDEEPATGSIKICLCDRISGRVIEIPEDGLIMGRSPKMADYRIVDNDSVGRKHCRVYYGDSGNLMVHDFESLNGTFVNNQKVNPDKDEVLYEGDIVSLANVEFKVITR